MCFLLLFIAQTVFFLPDELNSFHFTVFFSSHEIIYKEKGVLFSVYMYMLYSLYIPPWFWIKYNECN